MARKLGAASLLVAFSLLTSAATAHAECAWVWWEQTTTWKASPKNVELLEARLADEVARGREFRQHQAPPAPSGSRQTTSSACRRA
jgi:hypothetical protein